MNENRTNEDLPRYSRDGLIVENRKNGCVASELMEITVEGNSNVFGLGAIINGLVVIRPRLFDIHFEYIVVELALQVGAKRESLDTHHAPFLEKTLYKKKDYIFPFNLRVPYYSRNGELLPPNVHSNIPCVHYKLNAILLPKGHYKGVAMGKSVEIIPEYKEWELKQGLLCQYTGSATTVLKNVPRGQPNTLLLTTESSPVLTPFDPTSIPLYAEFMGSHLEIKKIRYSVIGLFKNSKQKVLDRKEFATTTKWRNPAPIEIPIQPVPNLKVPSLRYKNTTVTYTVSISLSTNYGLAQLSIPAIATLSPPKQTGRART